MFVRVLAASALAVLTASAQAQTNSLFGNSGAVSQSGGSFNQLGTTSSSGGTSRATQGRQDGGMTAGTQQGGLQAGALAETGSLGAQIGQSGFVGGRGNAESFIGARQQTGTGQQSGNFGTRGGQSANFGALQGGRGGGASYGEGGDYGGQQSQQSRNAQRAISLRPQQRLGFAYSRPTPEVIAANLNARFARITAAPATPNVTPPARQQIQMEMDNQGVLTLRGTVETADARKLAEVMARLEPGVRKVANELEVQPAN
jgi:hypothetical protein